METQKFLEITERISYSFLYFISLQDFEKQIFSSLKLENDVPSFDSSEFIIENHGDFSLEYSTKQNLKEINRKLGIFELSSKFDTFFKELSSKYGFNITEQIRNKNNYELEYELLYPEFFKIFSDYDYLVFEVVIEKNKIIPFLEEFIKSKEFIYDLIGKKNEDSNAYKGAIIYPKAAKPFVEKFIEEIKDSDFFYRRLYLKKSLRMEDFKSFLHVQTRMIVKFWKKNRTYYFEKFEGEMNVIQFLKEKKVFFFQYDPIKKIEAKENIHLILNFLLNKIQFLSIEINKQYWEQGKTIKWKKLIILVTEQDKTIVINILGKYKYIISFIKEYLSEKIKNEWINYVVFDKSRFKTTFDHEKFDQEKRCILSGFEEKFNYLKIEFQKSKKSFEMIMEILRDYS